ncbi:amino acid transporter AVT1D-like [Impatiens glandulifera]|uniref:amino acid transporter AVT1D-like n=1 Tax=Impatiens glandulifera TaxID=253017 RepID=UPI001FB17F61|nr:amino acid transporter AVT1D-like [Impatiens glandulifera]
MKGDDDFGPDRRIEFETDDEENEAQRACDSEDDSDSDSVDHSRHASGVYVDSDELLWPQSYRQSIDMYSTINTNSFSFLRGSQSSNSDSLLTTPLVTVENPDNEGQIGMPLIDKPISSQTGFFVDELPPPSEQCSYLQTVLNAINILCGIGLVSTPYALKQGGWWSLSILFILGMITCYTGVLLKRCLESSRDLKTYPDIGQAAFGVSGRIILAITLYMELYSSCVEYLIMMSDNLSSFMPNANMSFAGSSLDSFQLCVIISTLCILPTVWLRNLSLLSYLSVGGVVTAILVSVCLFWVGTIDNVGFHPNDRALEIAKLPITIGLFGFCYGSHSVFPNIYSSMKDPSRFPSVLIISFISSTLLYAGVAVCGFLMFGDETKSQFTLNMPPEFTASKVAAWTMFIAPLTKYALTITPIAFSIEELLPSAKLSSSYGRSIIIRTILVASTFVVALSFPYFGSVMAFIGSFLVMLLSIVYPCACYLSITRGRLSNLEVATNVVIMMIGLFCALVGTYSAIASAGEEKGQ